MRLPDRGGFAARLLYSSLTTHHDGSGENQRESVSSLVFLKCVLTQTHVRTCSQTNEANGQVGREDERDPIRQNSAKRKRCVVSHPRHPSHSTLSGQGSFGILPGRRILPRLLHRGMSLQSLRWSTFTNFDLQPQAGPREKTEGGLGK